MVVCKRSWIRMKVLPIWIVLPTAANPTSWFDYCDDYNDYFDYHDIMIMVMIIIIIIMKIVMIIMIIAIIINMMILTTSNIANGCQSCIMIVIIVIILVILQHCLLKTNYIITYFILHTVICMTSWCMHMHNAHPQFPV